MNATLKRSLDAACLLLGPAALLAAAGAIGVSLVQSYQHGYFASGDTFLVADLLHRQLCGDLGVALGLGVLLIPVALLWSSLGGRWLSLLPYLLLIQLVVIGCRVIYAWHWSTWVVTNKFGVIPFFLRSRDRLLEVVVASIVGLLLVVVLHWLLRTRLHRESPGRHTVRACFALFCTAILIAIGARGSVAWLQPEAPARPFNIVWFTWDTTRADHLSAYGYPRPTTPTLESLAAESWVFETALSQQNWTLPSYASMFSGRPPWELPGERLNRPEWSLTEHLRRHGYRTYAYVQNPNVSASFGFDQGFEYFLWVPQWEDPHRMNRYLRERIQELEDLGEPFFLFVHYQGPHFPYQLHLPWAKEFSGLSGPPISDEEYARLMKTELNYWSKEDPAARKSLHWARALYDADIRDTDEAMADTIEMLRAAGVWDDALVVFNSDHGDEFLEHGGFGHARDNIHPELTRVPMLLRLPPELEVAPRRIRVPVQNLDLLPTLLSVLGIEHEERAGRALWPSVPSSGPRTILSSSKDNAFVMVRRGRWALLFNRKTEEAKLFDRRNDPGELRPISDAASYPIYAQLVDVAKEWKASLSTSDEAAPDVPADVRDALRALGYVD